MFSACGLVLLLAASLEGLCTSVTSAVICLSTCWGCKFDVCPNTPHSWGDEEDFYHAWMTGQEAPGFCGCSCGRPERPTDVKND